MTYGLDISQPLCHPVEIIDYFTVVELEVFLKLEVFQGFSTDILVIIWFKISQKTIKTTAVITIFYRYNHTFLDWQNLVPHKPAAISENPI